MRLAGASGGISLDEIAKEFSVSRRTAEHIRDAVAHVFPQLEEIEGERPKPWRLPSGLSGIFREPLGTNSRPCAAAKRLEREGRKDLAAPLNSFAAKIEVSLKPARRRMLAPDIEAVLEAEGFASRPGPRLLIPPESFVVVRQAILQRRRLAFAYRQAPQRRSIARSCPTPALRPARLSGRHLSVGAGAGELPPRPDDRPARQRV